MHPLHDSVECDDMRVGEVTAVNAYSCSCPAWTVRFDPGSSLSSKCRRTGKTWAAEAGGHGTRYTGSRTGSSIFTVLTSLVLTRMCTSAGRVRASRQEVHPGERADRAASARAVQARASDTCRNLPLTQCAYLSERVWICQSFSLVC